MVLSQKDLNYYETLDMKLPRPRGDLVDININPQKTKNCHMIHPFQFQ